ncbi:MAG: hypothetical protein HGA85_05440 [Nanoarchaeota archaeon]|nr:hypothetical protein [Nanoarchaeota archaeon]
MARLTKGGYGILYALSGYLLAICLHFFHNLMSSMSGVTVILSIFLDWSGFAAMLVLIIVMIFKEKEIMRMQLAEEVSLGTIKETDYQAMMSVFARFSIIGNSRKTKLYDLCGKLAFKKHIVHNLPDEKHNHAAIENLRMQISGVSD